MAWSQPAHARPPSRLFFEAIVMTTVVRFAVPCLHLFLAIPAIAQAPDPVALLRGAEAARRVIQSGELEFTVEETWQPRKPETKTVFVKFDGPKRTIGVEADHFVLAGTNKAEGEANRNRFAALNYDMDKAATVGAGRKEHWRTNQAYDGAQFCNYDESRNGNACYRKIDVDGQMVFDPRTLGLVESYHTVLDLSFFFSNSQAKNTALVGKEIIGSTPTWHVRYDMSARYHFWIEDREPFRVHKAEYEGVGNAEGFRSTIVSTFKDDGSPLPFKVAMKSSIPNGVEMEGVLTVRTAKLNVPVNPKVGTLDSLDLPVGVDVVDAIEQKYLGVWDGEKIVSKDKYEVDRVSQFGWQQIVSATGVLALFIVAIAYLWWRHRRSERVKSPDVILGGPRKRVR
jgi:hypothetical protein